jgi:hypothetical protein
VINLILILIKDQKVLEINQKMIKRKRRKGRRKSTFENIVMIYLMMKICSVEKVINKKERKNHRDIFEFIQKNNLKASLFMNISVKNTY